MALLPTKLTKAVTDKFSVVNNTFFREAKVNPKDRIQIEVGDSKQTDFKPQVKIMRWDNEVNFSLRAQEDSNATVKTEGEVIKYITPEYEVHQYDKPDASEDGGFEFEWVLPKKPASNVLTATIQTKGLDFFYQPALTQEEIDEGSERPANVVGSYAVYHSTKGGMNDAAGMEYKVGKAFHIYRPKIADANGDSIWGELNIDEAKGELTVTINQAWLNNAVYPVVVDPTFGYTSIGGSNYSTLTDGMRGTKGTGDGTVTSITFYNKTDANDDGPLSLGLYQYGTSGGNDSVFLARATEVSSPANATPPDAGGWVTCNLTTTPSISSGNTYYATSYFEEASMQYDTASGGAGYNVAYATPGTFPDPANPTDFSTIWSVYATYTASGGAATEPTGRMTPNPFLWGP